MSRPKCFVAFVAGKLKTIDGQDSSEAYGFTPAEKIAALVAELEKVSGKIVVLIDDNSHLK